MNGTCSLPRGASTCSAPAAAAERCFGGLVMPSEAARD
jgi:hypothetical protein